MLNSNPFAAISGSLPEGFMKWYVALMILSVIAGTMGYETATASTLTEIDAQIAEHHDLILLDLSLGETDGMTVMRTLADRQAGANLVLLTGADQAVINGARKVAELSGFNVVAACAKSANITQIEDLLRERSSIVGTGRDSGAVAGADAGGGGDGDRGARGADAGADRGAHGGGDSGYVRRDAGSTPARGDGRRRVQCPGTRRARRARICDRCRRLAVAWFGAARCDRTSAGLPRSLSARGSSARLERPRISHPR